MKQVVIENPVLNSPFWEPALKNGKQQSLFETEWTQDRIEENRFVNEVRRHVSFWRNRKAIRRLFLYKESIVFAAGGNNFRHKERIKYVSYV